MYIYIYYGDDEHDDDYDDDDEHDDDYDDHDDSDVTWNCSLVASTPTL